MNVRLMQRPNDPRHYRLTRAEVREEVREKRAREHARRAPAPHFSLLHHPFSALGVRSS